MVEVELRGNSLHIEANDQTEAIRLAKDAVLEDGLLIFAQRMDKGERAEDEAPERTGVIWRPGHEWSDQKKHVANRNVTGQWDQTDTGIAPSKIDALGWRTLT
jgi:hypothetical protein